MPPLGWYYAQGLIPLGYDSSDDDEGPATLPNGRMVCGRHGFPVCHKCCVDFSFMEDESDFPKDEEDEEDEELIVNNNEGGDSGFTYVGLPADPNLRKGTGRVFPTEFHPPNQDDKPTVLFPGGPGYMYTTKYSYRTDPQKFLIYTDGACLNNGQPNPKAGWAFVLGPGDEGPRSVSSRLEAKGPYGDDSEQSSNRAELRAVIGALQFRHWPGAGCKTMVIATDSEYVVKGCTAWARSWVRNDWRTAGRQPVKNKDLWLALLGEIERWHDEGMEIQFWRIPREWNELADAAAKKAAAMDEVPERCIKFSGMGLW